MLRNDGRASGQLRPLRIVPHYLKHPTGSVLIEFGETKVICAVTVEDNIPPFLRNASPPQGWLTAEYSMLPAATGTRTKRERQNVSGRTQEIQRLIGRSLRSVVDLYKCPDMTFMIDCDVIQADGGTRTASITGAFVAMKIAIDKLLRSGRLKANPLKDSVAAVSVGLLRNELFVDLNYIEDSTADLDMNIVMTQSGKILEIQGTAERSAFDKDQVMAIIDMAGQALEEVFALQLAAAEGQEVQS